MLASFYNSDFPVPVLKTLHNYRSGNSKTSIPSVVPVSDRTLIQENPRYIHIFYTLFHLCPFTDMPLKVYLNIEKNVAPFLHVMIDITTHGIFIGFIPTPPIAFIIQPQRIT
jgi:hypothetical protein